MAESGGDLTPVPLSWQQSYALRTEAAASLPRTSLVAVVQVDPELTDAELSALVAEAEAGVDALRLRIDSAESGHLLPPTAPEQFEFAEHRLPWTEHRLPWTEHRRFGSDAEVRTDIEAVWAELAFSHTEGPLWSVLVYDRVDAAGTPTARWLAWFFDHLISDMASVELFKEAFCQEPKAFDELDSYVEWLHRQASSFTTLDTPDAEFWRQYLQDAPVNICDRLPARIAGRTELGSLLTVTGRTLLVDGDQLWQLCGEREVSPFMVISCAVALAVAEAAAAPDLIFQLSTHGRDEDSLQVFGYLSNLVPLRLRIPDVSRPLAALDRVRVAVEEAGAHCATPLPYINRVAGMSRPDELGDSTVTLNFVAQLPLSAQQFLRLQEATPAGEESGLWIDIMQREEGGFYLLVKYDHTWYHAEQIEQLCDEMVARWQQLLASA